MIRRPRAFALLLPALLLAAGAAAATHDFPAASLGDLWFQVDHAGFRDDSGQVIEEYYFRIGNNQLEFRPVGDDEELGPQEARVFVKLEFEDADEEKIGEAKRRFEFEVVDATRAASTEHSQLLLLREPLDPRTAYVKVTVEDLNARKRGLLYMVTGKRRNGEVRAAFVAPPDTTATGLGVSDLQYAWGIAEAGSASDFEKNGYDVIPNPGRTYGLLQPDASVYYEIYDPMAGPENPVAYDIVEELLGPDSTRVAARTDTVSVRTPRWVRTYGFGVEERPAGEYFTRATVIRLGDRRDTVTVERSFGVVWGTASWGRTEEDILDEARVLFTEDEFENFRDMSAADREVYYETFWAEHDPTPGSRTNELREEFYRRVRRANDLFKDHGRKGMLTDRGRIYVRFGEPDEVERELMPTRDRQLDQLVSQVDDPSAQRLTSPDQFDTRPFEVWLYTQQGNPLFPNRELSTSVVGLEFVFVDETGTGHYVLRYQSDFVNY